MFWGRTREIGLLREWDRKTPRLTVLYGRRRVGKTRLVEEAFEGASLLKIEGLEGEGQTVQQKLVLGAAADFLGKPELRFFRPDSWISIFKMLSDSLGKKPRVVFLDEFQWLASGRTKLVSHLKYAWDNFFSKNNKIHLIVCGSVSSFMINRVLKSKALYGRVDLEIHLQPLRLWEIKDYFTEKRSLKELIELYMVLGGIPQYLKMVDRSRSALLNIEKLCFTPNGYLVNEFERLFASHFGKNRHYRDIILALARNGWANREKLQRGCQIDSGGRISEYMANLETAGFVESYAPVDKPGAIRNMRYRICDPYLFFFFRFIHPKRNRISQLRGYPHLSQFLPDNRYKVFKGLAFERICYLHRQEIADRLGFGAVNYQAGSWFAKGRQNEKAQIDLVYIRADGVTTICEMKFTDKKVGLELIKDTARKTDIFSNPKNHTLEKVLLSAAEPTEQLLNQGYFNRILTIDDIFSS